MRKSVYKEKIISLLCDRHFLTIAEIHKEIPEADYSTVFRNLEQLLKEKRVRKVLVDNKSTAYESVDDKHDHFICTDCGKVEVIHLNLTNFNGNKVEDVLVRGVCGECGE